MITHSEYPHRVPSDDYVTAALTLVTDAGNNSNLILDPDLDSFYVMDEWITKLAPLLDTAGKASNLMRSLTAAAGASLERRITLALDQGSISTNLNGINADLTTAFAHTADRGLRSALAPSLTALNSAVNTFSQALQTSVKSGHAGPTTAGLFDDVLTSETGSRAGVARGLIACSRRGSGVCRRPSAVSRSSR